MAKAKRSATAGGSLGTPEGGKYTRTRSVTLPVFKVEVEVPLYLMVNGPMFIGKPVEAKTGADGKKGVPMEPATIMPVTNIETGEVGQIIVNAALKSILDETYPKDSYVEKSFEIVKHEKRAGKRYHTFSVFEIEA
jgi:hypothetical protein